MSPALLSAAGGLFATATMNDLWYSVPLIVAISLVYAATRHEEMPEVLGRAVRVALWIVGFMAAIFGLLVLLGWAA